MLQNLPIMLFTIFAYSYIVLMLTIFADSDQEELLLHTYID